MLTENWETLNDLCRRTGSEPEKIISAIRVSLSEKAVEIMLPEKTAQESSCRFRRRENPEVRGAK